MEDLKSQQLRANDVLANERTYLAYVRTALAFIAFGFVIARFALFEREFALIVHTSPGTSGTSTAFGTGMAVFGVIVAILGAWRYSATHAGLLKGRVIALPTLAGYVISLLIAAIGATVAYALLTYR